MALYLADGGGSDRLLGLSCRHVLISSKEASTMFATLVGLLETSSCSAG
jgi:hypothetical protein